MCICVYFAYTHAQRSPEPADSRARCGQWSEPTAPCRPQNPANLGGKGREHAQGHSPTRGGCMRQLERLLKRAAKALSHRRIATTQVPHCSLPVNISRDKGLVCGSRDVGQALRGAGGVPRAQEDGGGGQGTDTHLQPNPRVEMNIHFSINAFQAVLGHTCTDF